MFDLCKEKNILGLSHWLNMYKSMDIDVMCCSVDEPLSSLHFSYHMTQSPVWAGAAIRSNGSVSLLWKNAHLTFIPCALSLQSDLASPSINEAAVQAEAQTSMTCQSDVSQTHSSAACHQMHLSERGDARAGRPALNFKVTSRVIHQRRGVGRERWGWRENKGNLLTFSSTHLHLRQKTIHKYQDDHQRWRHSEH